MSPVINAIFGLSMKCRFVPSCSEYSLKTYQAYGFFKGTWLTIIRLLKCHPFHEGGVDLVPKTFTFFKKSG